MLTEFVIFIPSLPPHLQQFLDLFFFGNYSNTPSADQSTSLSALTDNDLQIGVGTADNTGSTVDFAAANMKHVNALAIVNLNGKTVPQTYYYDGNTGNASSVRAASTTKATVWPSVSFSSAVKPYNASNTSSLKKYVAIVNPNTATTISTSATSGCQAWSLSFNVGKNVSSSQSVTSSRPGYYLGWVYSYKGAVETFTAPENANYKLEVWGAVGGRDWQNLWGGLGGYSYGNLELNKDKQLFICVGNKGQRSNEMLGYESTMYLVGTGGYNGGGNGQVGGGGATHIANLLEGNGLLSDYKSNKAEVILVAGGGGGNDGSPNIGYGGGLVGGNGDSSTTGGNTSTNTGGVGYNNGEFGKGADAANQSDSAGAGGSGWYGGGSSILNNASNGTGGGGSGYVNTSILTNALTIAGNTSFTSPSGGTETGHAEDGYAIITQLSY